MENKPTALLFVEGEIIKIVVGKTLKCIAFSEVKVDHNVRFIDQLFSQTNVIVVDRVNTLTKDAFYEFVGENKPAPKAPEKQMIAQRRAPENPRKSTETILQEAQEESESMLFRSLEETTIIVDDLPTGEDLPNLPGEKRMLAIHPGRALDLSLLPQENVKKSSILRRLIREQKLVPCTRSEAVQIEAEYASRQREDNDARLDQASPIISERASDFASRSRGKFDVNTDDSDPIEISTEAPSEDEESMINLLRNPAESNPMDDVEELTDEITPAPKRPLATRPTPMSSSGIKAKGIGRK